MMVTVGIGDIHGRFARVEEWLRALPRVDLAFAVGDVEAFLTADDHRRKAVKRQMPAEYAEYAQGRRALPLPIHFIGGNNEDFETLHRMQGGGELPGGLRYLGRVGVTELGGLRVAFLSGIYAPKHFQTPLLAPTTADTRKRAGYFRESELTALENVGQVDLMLLHEWPRGLLMRKKSRRPLRAYRFPWIGNPIAKALVEKVRPKWLWCGHSHVPYATTLRHADGGETHVACLDQATRPDASLFWLEWDGRTPVRAGWGISGQTSWTAGKPWDERLTPEEATNADEW
ncbi:MAG: metallophosphoesterase [Myxococcota bacterium]